MIDPHRTLGVLPGATQAEIKRAYRRMAKQYHPDSAGPKALPRFLAIQAAYETLLASGHGQPRGSANERPKADTSAGASAAWRADAERAQATREAYRARYRSASSTAGRTAGPPAGPAADEPRAAGRSSRGSAGTGAGASRGSASGAPSPKSRAGRRRTKATIGSTSYDGADAEPFSPSWEGATWYGPGSGTYWTVNPKEYADPRKHGPEYQARSRRRSKAGGQPAADDLPKPEGVEAGGDPFVPPGGPVWASGAAGG